MYKFKKNHSDKNQQGSLLIYNIVIIFIFSLVMLGILSYATIQLRVARSSVNREIAFQIAEAGVNYYQWHLAHFPNDYWDGYASSTPGPFVHKFIDKDSNQVFGKFSLNITPPSNGSSIITIESTGATLQDIKQERVITVNYGISSLAQYAFLSNSDAWVSSTENVNGQFFTNGGIHFDGTGNAKIFSAKASYSCGAYLGCTPTSTQPGIWGSAPTSTQALWQFPVSNLDFSSLNSDFAAMKSKAQTAGLYLPPSNKQGYTLIFKSDGTVDVYKTNTLNNDPTGWDVNGVAHNNTLDYKNLAFQFNQAIPGNGLIYVEDNTWVEGVVKGRVTVAAARLPYNVVTAPSIVIQNSIVYAAKDGTNSLGLIAQKDVLVGYLSSNNLEIDAAMIAQNGSAQRYYWPGNVKNSIIIYGAIASFGSWTWNWVDGGGNTVSGYANTSTVYDPYLLYSPPPSYPLSPGGYQQISWSSN